MSDVLRIDGSSSETEDRFARFRLISWWDQERLATARVLVIGAGALGNEILKDLALLGVGHVFVADRDRIENSNLSRSILFRERDCGRPKAEVAAEKTAEIYGAIQVQPFVGNIVHDLGLGVYRWADVILGGLDNREARVAINHGGGTGGQGLDRRRHRAAGRSGASLRPGHRPLLRVHHGRERLEDARGEAQLRTALSR